MRWTKSPATSLPRYSLTAIQGWSSSFISIEDDDRPITLESWPAACRLCLYLFNDKHRLTAPNLYIATRCTCTSPKTHVYITRLAGQPYDDHDPHTSMETSRPSIHVQYFAHHESTQQVIKPDVAYANHAMQAKPIEAKLQGHQRHEATTAPARAARPTQKPPPAIIQPSPVHPTPTMTAQTCQLLAKPHIHPSPLSNLDLFITPPTLRPDNKTTSKTRAYPHLPDRTNQQQPEWTRSRAWSPATLTTRYLPHFETRPPAAHSNRY